MNTATLNSHPVWAYLQLMRPANIITAWADVLAGFAASELVFSMPEQASLTPLAWLLLSSTGLYGGGIVLNDVFDAQLDAKERPERPIPSGRASSRTATLLGGSLLGAGIIAAAQVSWLSATLAAIVAFAAVVYNAFGKHHRIFGPLNMGICRGGNLLLGVSVIPAMVEERWYLAIIPIVYIAAITLLSQSEVQVTHNSDRIIATLLIVAVIAGLLGLGYLKNYQLLAALPFVVLFAARVLLPFIKAIGEPTPQQIKVAVKAGVLSLIVLDATLAAGFANLPYGCLVLGLLPISMVLAQIFAVT